ncbi:glycosyltransferase family 2 protein [Arthrobacter sp. GCM10027362]|uniref:glycosyltransferase family 2 protein n=1 Tax=Arthrobacter sp. GCM10027362 TaxID=3273379 RepID=UPI003642B43A
MPDPLVSVIVPARDQAGYIADALVSLERQFADPAVLEIIVIDDGSTDGTGDLAARFSRVVDLAQLVYPRRPTQFSPGRRNTGYGRSCCAPIGSWGRTTFRCTWTRSRPTPGWRLRIFSRTRQPMPIRTG